MSVIIGAALKKIAVALLTDRGNWEKIAVALFAVLLLFLLPIQIGRASCRERV